MWTTQEYLKEFNNKRTLTAVNKLKIQQANTKYKSNFLLSTTLVVKKEFTFLLVISGWCSLNSWRYQSMFNNLCLYIDIEFVLPAKQGCTTPSFQDVLFTHHYSGCSSMRPILLLALLSVHNHFPCCINKQIWETSLRDPFLFHFLE